MNFKHDVSITDIELFSLNVRGGVSPNMVLGQMPERPALLVKLLDSEGCFGWGEIWSNFPPRANIHKAQLVEDVMKTYIVGASFGAPLELTDYLRAKLSTYFLHIGQSQVFEHILAGLDTAAWDICLRRAGHSFASFMGVEPSAQCYASALNPDDLEKRLETHIAMGQTEFKLKIGFDVTSDRALVAKAFERLPDGSRLMIDSNQSWQLDVAVDSLQSLEAYHLLFAEEPIRADRPLQEWENLAKNTNIPLAAGENIYGMDKFIQMANAGVKFLQPDVAKWGGITGALELAKALPQECQLWPHFMGSAVGQQAGLAISAAIGAKSKCEMDVNENKLRTTLCAPAISVEDGKVSLSSEPGLLMPPAQEDLQSFAIV